MTTDGGSEAYRILLLEKLGYPLWYPDLDENLPATYLEQGVRIGDVGIITEGGQFDFIFNVHGGDCSRHISQPWASHEPFSNSNIRSPGTIIKRGDVTRTDYRVDASIPVSATWATIGAGVEFTCSTDESAILVLPDGASGKGLKKQSLKEFRRLLTADVALQWFNTTGSTSLTLVTSCIKSRSWGVASVSKKNRGGSVTLNFSLTQVGGTFTGSYSWHSSSGGHYRDGPKPPSNTDNQCVFLSGFRLLSREYLVKLVKWIAVANPEDLKKPDSNPLKGWEKLLSGSDHTSGTSERGRGNQAGLAEADQDSANEDDVFIEELAELSEHRHPLDVINEFLLKEFSEARVAVTHDDDWCALIEDADEQFPDDEELLMRVRRKYTPILESGLIGLVPRIVSEANSQDFDLALDSSAIKPLLWPFPFHSEVPLQAPPRQAHNTQRLFHETKPSEITLESRLALDMGPCGMDLKGQVRILPTPGQPYQWRIRAGAFSSVFKGQLLPVTTSGMVDAKPIFVAVKILRLSDNNEWKAATRHTTRESYIWIHLDHPNILPYLGYCSDLAPLPALVSPYCENGTIMEYITKQPSSNRLQLVKEVANGLMYLHSQDVIHCDLLPTDVLVNEQGHAVLTGFGRAKVIGNAVYNDSVMVGLAAYMAPELFPPEGDVDINKLYSTKSDVYAFGILCFEIFTGQQPFACYNARHDWQVVPLIQKGKRPLHTAHVQHCISQDMWAMMEACWTTMPEDRPSAAQIVQRIH